MKYIKTYEAKQLIKNNYPYWKLLSNKQPYLDIALKKIGMSPIEIKWWSNFFKDANFDENNDILIIKHDKNYPNERINQKGYWDFTTDLKKMLKYLPNWNYMGEIVVEDWEYQTYKFNL